MITGMDAGKLAFFGTVILALGSLIGGIGGVATKTYLESAQQEENKRSNQKTDVYLEFLRTRLLLDRANGAFNNFKDEIGENSTQEQRRELAELEKKKHDASDGHFGVRDRLIIFGSTKIVSDVAKYERQRFLRDQPELAKQPRANDTGSGTIDSPLPELVLAFRHDAIGEDDIDLLDVLAVMCEQTKTCFGVPVEVYLGKKDN